MQPFQAAILAGGAGTRLRAEVSDRNKVAADVNGIPFMAYMLSWLENSGFHEVIICSGYHHDDLVSRLGDNFGNLRLIYSRESRPMGTAGALRLASPFFSSDAIIVLNGDTYCDLNFHQLARQHQVRCSKATLAAVGVEDARRFGRLVIDGGNKIIQFREKDNDPAFGFINAGVYALNTALIEKIPFDQHLSLEQDIFPHWAQKGLIDVFCHQGRFIDIGTVASYKQARRRLRSLDVIGRVQSPLKIKAERPV
jgi:D-glycero-alpha-D-manno-heptose 1-phosphate guanylyltransferase